MIKDARSKFDDYSISYKIRQILLHWSYDLRGKNFFINLTNYCTKMSYHWFNRQEILQKVKERCSKEKAAEYYLKNKEAIKSQESVIKSFNKKKKTRLRSTKEKNIKNCFGIKKEALKSFVFF